MDRQPNGYSWKEMLAILFSRLIDDGERIVAGAHTEVFFGATLLAQKRHAPNLRLQLGGTCLLVNVVDKEIKALPRTSTDYSILQWAESHHDHPNTFLQYRAPGGTEYYRDSESSYRDVRTYRHFFAGDKFFVGGIEVDARGNVNLIGIGNGHELTFRGPGSVGICDAAVGFRELFVFVTQHDPRRLVEKVSFISLPGNEGLERHGYAARIRWIVTPRAIFDFHPQNGRARLFAVMPGTSVEWVAQNTGFEFERVDPVIEVPGPAPEELEFLRTEIDPTGVLA